MIVCCGKVHIGNQTNRLAKIEARHREHRTTVPGRIDDEKLVSGCRKFCSTSRELITQHEPGKLLTNAVDCQYDTRRQSFLLSDGIHYPVNIYIEDMGLLLMDPAVPSDLGVAIPLNTNARGHRRRTANLDQRIGCKGTQPPQSNFRVDIRCTDIWAVVRGRVIDLCTGGWGVFTGAGGLGVTREVRDRFRIHGSWRSNNQGDRRHGLGRQCWLGEGSASKYNSVQWALEDQQDAVASTGVSVARASWHARDTEASASAGSNGMSFGMYTGRCDGYCLMAPAVFSNPVKTHERGARGGNLIDTDDVQDAGRERSFASSLLVGSIRRVGNVALSIVNKTAILGHLGVVIQRYQGLCLCDRHDVDMLGYQRLWLRNGLHVDILRTFQRLLLHNGHGVDLQLSHTGSGAGCNRLRAHSFSNKSHCEQQEREAVTR
ncbi:hypothetical protein N7541_005083 [Penicillium brevicompactum]|uniref:Uncharacterized protein n=1 Tax=Penicillium brevicompactum TaxID=5074 RepID=A0A9W9UWL0_PENBR|nr:hypothetical protein N7541_005083 [Penicillium brevicompactum]